MSQTVIVNSGVGIGNIIAAIISWKLHQDILWCIVHGILGWIYVIYYLLKY